MKILITGGFGYLGGVITKFLLDKGYNIRIFDLKAPEKIRENDKCEVQIGSILSKHDLKKACSGVDCIIHLAGLDQERCKEDPKSAMEINGLGTKYVLEAGEEAGVKVMVYFSTFHVYGNPSGRITEETMPMPVSEYGISKYIGELYCRQLNRKMNAVVLRLSNAYGASESDLGWNLVVNNFCKQCFTHKKIVLKSQGRQKRNFVSVNDVTHAVYLLLKQKPEEINGKIFNVGSSDAISIIDLAKLVVKIHSKSYGKEAGIVIEPNAKDEDVIDFDYRYDKIKKMGYLPKHTLQDEIKSIFKTLEND